MENSKFKEQPSLSLDSLLDGEGNTPWLACISKGSSGTPDLEEKRIDCLEYLREKGSNIYALNKPGESCLHLASTAVSNVTYEMYRYRYRYRYRYWYRDIDNRYRYIDLLTLAC